MPQHGTTGTCRLGNQLTGYELKDFLVNSILWFSRAFLLQSKNPSISVYINTKCLLTYSQKSTQTWPLTFIQENLSTSSQPQSPRGNPISTSLSSDHTTRTPFTRSICALPTVRALGDVWHSLAMPTKQVLAKDLEAQLDFPQQELSQASYQNSAGRQFSLDSHLFCCYQMHALKTTL